MTPLLQTSKYDIFFYIRNHEHDEKKYLCLNLHFCSTNNPLNQTTHDKICNNVSHTVENKRKQLVIASTESSTIFYMSWELILENTVS